MDGFRDGWIRGWVDGWINRWMNRWRKGKEKQEGIYGSMDSGMDELKDRWIQEGRDGISVAIFFIIISFYQQFWMTYL